MAKNLSGTVDIPDNELGITATYKVVDNPKAGVPWAIFLFFNSKKPMNYLNGVLYWTLVIDGKEKKMHKSVCISAGGQPSDTSTKLDMVTMSEPNFSEIKEVYLSKLTSAGTAGEKKYSEGAINRR